MSSVRNLRAMKSDLSGKEESLLETGGALHVTGAGAGGAVSITGGGVGGSVQVVGVGLDGYHAQLVDTHVIKVGAGILQRIVVNTPVASSEISVYDGLNLKAVITVPAAGPLSPVCLEYGLAFTTSLIVVMGVAASDITVIYS